MLLGVRAEEHESNIRRWPFIYSVTQIDPLLKPMDEATIKEVAGSPRDARFGDEAIFSLKT
jgi:hypothetical protein